MSVRRRVLENIALATVVALIVSACSSSDKEGTGDSQPPAGAARSASTSSGAGTAGSSNVTASGSPINVGVICSCSGPFGGSQSIGWKTLQAWGKSVNASGGIAGHPVEFVFKDNGTNPGTDATDAQQLASANVAAIIDIDILDQVWQKTADAAKIPVLGGDITNAPYYTDPNWYPSGQTNDSITYSVVATAKQAGVTNLAQMYCAESPGCQEQVPQVTAAGKELGVPVVYNVSVAATAPNYTAQCLAAKQSGADGVFVADSMSVIARVASDCDKQGYDPTFITEGTGFTNQTLSAPGLKDHLWSEFPILPYFSSKPSVKAMNAAIDKYYPGLRSDTVNWSEFSAQVWTGALLLAQALKNANVTASQQVTSEVVTHGLNMTKNETLGGFSPTLTFTAGKVHKVDCWYIGRVENGQARQVGGLTCHKGD